MEPRPGDYRLISIAGDTGKLIRFGQWLNGDGYADFEHAAVYVGNHQFIEAAPKGARLMTYALDSDRPVMWSGQSIALSAAQRIAIVNAAFGYLGTGYSYADYVAIAAHTVGMDGRVLQRFIADTGHMICSQLVDQCYADAGVHLFTDGRWPGYVTPGDLYKVIKGIDRGHE